MSGSVGADDTFVGGMAARLSAAHTAAHPNAHAERKADAAGRHGEADVAVRTLPASSLVLPAAHALMLLHHAALLSAPAPAPALAIVCMAAIITRD